MSGSRYIANLAPITEEEMQESAKLCDQQTDIAMQFYKSEDSDNKESRPGGASDPDDAKETAPNIDYDRDGYRISSNRQVGLVITNPINREGYMAESDTMEVALQHGGFDVIRVEWTNRSELMNAIVSRIKAKYSQCDGFLVFISSHGNIGHLKCSDGSAVAINDVLHTISSNLPNHIPLVVIIQACMGFTFKAMTVSGTEPAEYRNTNTTVNRHVESTRPHTVVLWATVNGRSAVRGAYSDSLAANICCADTQRDMMTPELMQQPTCKVCLAGNDGKTKRIDRQRDEDWTRIIIEMENLKGLVSGRDIPRRQTLDILDAAYIDMPEEYSSALDGQIQSPDVISWLGMAKMIDNLKEIGKYIATALSPLTTGHLGRISEKFPASVFHMINLPVPQTPTVQNMFDILYDQLCLEYLTIDLVDHRPFTSGLCSRQPDTETVIYGAEGTPIINFCLRMVHNISWEDLLTMEKKMPKLLLSCMPARNVVDLWKSKSFKPLLSCVDLSIVDLVLEFTYPRDWFELLIFLTINGDRECIHMANKVMAELTGIELATLLIAAERSDAQLDLLLLSKGLRRSSDDLVFEGILDTPIACKFMSIYNEFDSYAGKICPLVGKSHYHHALHSDLCYVLGELESYILNSKDDSGATIVHKAARKGWTKVLQAFVSKACEDSIFHALSTQDHDGHTPLHLALMSEFSRRNDYHETGFGSNDCLRMLLDSVSSLHRREILVIESYEGETVLHLAANLGSIQAVKHIVKCVPYKHAQALIMRRNSKSWTTVLHRADLSIVDFILEALAARDRFELLRSQALNGDTVLHRNIGNLQLVKCALQSLDFHYDRVVCLLHIKNRTNKTVLDLAENSAKIKKYLTELLSERHELETVQDQPLKDVKGPSDRNGGFREDSIFPGYVQDILTRDLVTVTRLGRDELHQVYPHEGSTTALQYNESERLLTYVDGFKSNHMTATSCAKAGLINHKRGPDSVACLWCRVLFCNFKAAIDVVALHMAYAEQVCEFIKHHSRRNIPLAANRSEDPPAGFLDLPCSLTGASGCGSQSVDSGFESHIPTQNPTMSAAASALTFASPNSTAEEATASSPPQNNIVDRYTQYERRLDVLVRDPCKGIIPDASPMRYEQNRLKSFTNKGWSTFYSEHLASAGFYLFEESNNEYDTFTIACPFCDGKIQNVTKDTIPMFTKEKDHSPLQVHILKFPACAFIQGNNLGHRSNVPMIAGEFRWNQSKVVTSAQANVGSELVTMGVATTQADCPPMAVYERRFDSYLTLPYDHPKGAEELASCGFFYMGKEGKVKCFWCGVECGSWSSGEDVWVRHARSMRSCQFVINEKGAEFVTHVIEEHGEWIDSQRDEDRIRNVTTRMIRPRMDAPVVQTVISNGYTRDHVKTAIINRLKKLKPDYTSNADLVSDVLSLRNRDMTYHRSLLLPDVPVEPRASASNTESQDVDGEDYHHENIVLSGAAIEVVEAADELASQQPEMSDEMEETQPKSVLDLSPEEGMTLTRQMMSQLTCKICISSSVGIIFLPCAHLVCCTACAAAMTQCPMCRRDIAGTIKANV